MLKTDRICVWIFIAVLALLLPSVKWLKPVDEMAALCLACLAMADCVVNGTWRRYRLLWVIMALLALYAAYSLTAVRYNTAYAVAVDYVIQLKPFVPFAVFLAVAPRLTGSDRRLLRAIAIVNATTVCVISCFSQSVVNSLIQHVRYVGLAAVLSFLTWLLCSVGPDGRISSRDRATAFLLLAMGLPCGRSKFYGTCVVALYFLTLYLRRSRPMPTRYQLLTGLTVGIIVAAVGWSKFRFYFIDMGSDLRNGGLESMARPALYAAAALIMVSHVPFGSGLASFASHASGEVHYSKIYYEYGLNNVYGLTPSEPDFVCDAFYPSLAQFGIAGLLLFAAFWFYIGTLLRRIRRLLPGGQALFAVAWTAILFIFIENIASTTFVQSAGLYCMMMLGMICSMAPEAVKTSTIHGYNP